MKCSLQHSQRSTVTELAELVHAHLPPPLPYHHMRAVHCQQLLWLCHLCRLLRQQQVPAGEPYRPIRLLPAGEQLLGAASTSAWAAGSVQHAGSGSLGCVKVYRACLLHMRTWTLPCWRLALDHMPAPPLAVHRRQPVRLQPVGRRLLQRLHVPTNPERPGLHVSGRLANELCLQAVTPLLACMQSISKSCAHCPHIWGPELPTSSSPQGRNMAPHLPPLCPQLRTPGYSLHLFRQLLRQPGMPAQHHAANSGPSQQFWQLRCGKPRAGLAWSARGEWLVRNGCT